MRRSVFLLYFIFTCAVFCQTATENSDKKSNVEEKVEGLPRSFHEIGLGMGLDDVKETLKLDESFAYRGDRDVSLLQSRNRSVIESEGVYFVKRGSFQFYNEKLYTIIVQNIQA